MKNVKVKIDIESETVTVVSDKVLSLTQELRLFRQELQKLPEGSEEFKILAQKMNDTDDAIKRVNVRSRDFFAALGTLPGILGTVGRSVDGVVDAFKIFGDIKLDQLKTQLNASFDDFKGIATTIGRLTGITKLYTVTNNFLANSFVKLGVGINTATIAARAFSAVITGLGIGVVIFGISKLVEAFSSLINPAKQATDAIEDFNDASDDFSKAYDQYASNINKLIELNRERLKTSGATDLEILESEKELLLEQSINALQREEQAAKELAIVQNNANNIIASNRELTKEEEEFLEERKRKFDAAVKLTAELEQDLLINEQKILQAQNEERKKSADERIKNLEEISKAQKEAYLLTLSLQEQEEMVVKEKYAALITLATAYSQDTKILEEGLAIELQAIRDKYTQQERDELQKQNDEKLALEISALDLRKAQGEIKEEEYQTALRDLRLKYAIDEQQRNEINADFLAFQRQNQFDKELADLDLLLAQKLISEEEYNVRSTELKLAYAASEVEAQQIRIDAINQAVELEKQALAETEAINQQIAQSWQDLATAVGQSFSSLANIFEEGSAASKAFGVISVVINAAAAFGKISTSLIESTAALSAAIAQGTATIASGTALLSNPVTAVIGGAQIAAGKAAIAAATAGLARAKATAVAQKVAVGITSAAQIATILGADKNSKSTAGAGEGATPTFSQTTGAAAPVIAASTANPQGELAGIVAGAITANNSQNRPIQAYVVGDQVSTQQQLDRRIALAAKMAG